MHEEHPELLRDQYWEEVVPKDLPYTVASEHYRRHEPPCSADHYKVKAEDAVYANLQAPRKSHDETYADYESVDTPLVERRKLVSETDIRVGSGPLPRHTRPAGCSAATGTTRWCTRARRGQLAPPAPAQDVAVRLVGHKSGRANTARTPDTYDEGDNRTRRPRQQHRYAAKWSDGSDLMTHQSLPQRGSSLGCPRPVAYSRAGQRFRKQHFTRGSAGTALAQAVLSPALTSAGIAPVLGGSPVVSPMTFTPMSVSQLSTLCVAAGTRCRLRLATIASTPLQGRAIATELTGVTTDKDSEHSSLGGGTGSGSAASVTGCTRHGRQKS
ncbi:hypothetical protein EVAR_100876_1 [Eumeta japonica]|uniref:Uncharacterized protein n=1 Tax=Eumeta variegata TaxID=151549 RepID=A0A4C1SU10_EUMVA|nr:hypothetical protein EVAR_100876_1 [Eumeta japonica]